jgi:gas vesicle protein
MRPMLLGFTALLLVLDDIAVFQRGGESLIGSFFDVFKNGELTTQITTIATAIGVLSLALGGITGSLKTIKGLGGIGAVLGATSLISQAPELGKKFASFLEEKTNIGDFIDKLLGNDLASINQRMGLNTALNANITNNVTINGIQEPKAVKDELSRGLDVITTQSLKKVQINQGNNLK